MSGWNPNVTRSKAYLTFVGNLVDGVFKGSYLSLSFLKIYGPYIDREMFWHSVEAGGIINNSNLIIAGDLNFTLTDANIWGAKTQMDPMDDFFMQMLLKKNLVDVAPAKIGPTWRNGRAGEYEISKHLDTFIVAEYLVLSMDRHRLWTISFSISNQLTICF